MFKKTNTMEDVVGLVDLGTSKVSCVILQRPRHSASETMDGWRTLGHSHVQSDGIRAGMLVDIERAEAATRRAIGMAEDEADLTLNDIVVGVSNGRLRSLHFSAAVDLAEHHVQRHDLRRLAQSARQYVEQQGKTLLYLNPVHFNLDQATTVLQPLGRRGQQLSCQFHAVTTDEATLLAFEQLAARCGLSIRSILPTGLASAYAATTQDERLQGVTCIDIGAGVTNIATMHEGRLLHVDTLAIGGANLTHDVSAMLNAQLADAERIKTLYGTMISAPSDYGVRIEYPQAGAAASQPTGVISAEVYTTSRADIAKILTPRAMRQLQLIGERLDQSKVTREFAQSIVLTGGGSQLVGLSSVAGELFSKPVRIGQRQLINGSNSSYTNPSASTVLGLGLAEVFAPTAIESRISDKIAYESYLKRMEQWLRESF